MTRIERVTSPLPRECSTTEPHGQLLFCYNPLLWSENQKIGAGEGNRTLVVSLEGFCSTIELHPQGDSVHSRLCIIGTIAGSSMPHQQQHRQPAKINLNTRRSNPFTAICFYNHTASGGGSWIRTNVDARSTDLQSAPFNHSGIPPKENLELCMVSISVSNLLANYGV